MRIGVLGSGLMGSKLGTLCARAGHDVVFSYSHSLEKLQKLAKKAGKSARAGTPAEAVSNADAILAAKIPEAHVVCAFSTAPSEVLLPVFERRKRRTVPDLVYCGDNKAAKKKAAALIRDVGFNPVDVGALSIARYVEPASLLLAEISYNGSRGPALAYRLEHLPKRKR